MYFSAAFRRGELSVSSFWAMKGYASSTCAHSKAHTHAGLTGCPPCRQVRTSICRLTMAKFGLPTCIPGEGFVEVSDFQEAEQHQMPSVVQHEQAYQCDALQN